MHLKRLRKGLVKRREDWRWSSYNNFAPDKGDRSYLRDLIDGARLPLGYRG